MKTTLTYSILIFASLMTAHAETIFEENFDNSSGSDKFVSYATGWKTYGGPTANDYTSNAGIAPIKSLPGSTGTDGFVKFSMGNSGATTGAFALIKDSLSLDMTDAEISWAATSQVNFVRSALMIQVNGTDWLISNTEFQPLTYTFDWTARASDQYINTLTFSQNAADWSTFTLTPGSAMSVGSTLTEDLSSATITGIGVYTWNLNASSGTGMYIDTLTVVVPETNSTSLFLAIACIGLLALRRRIR